MISPYVYLGGKLKLAASGRSSADMLNGLDLDEQRANVRAGLFRHARQGAPMATVDLKDKIFRRYAYWLRIELHGRRCARLA